MWTRVEQLIETSRPKLHGCDIVLIDTLEGVVTLRLTPTKDNSPDQLEQVRATLIEALTSGLPMITDVIFETRAADGLEGDDPLAIVVGEPDDATDTCRFTLNRSIADRAAYYGNSAQARGKPLVETLFGIPGVASILVKDNIIIVSRLDGTWSYLSHEIERTLRAHFEGTSYQPSSPSPPKVSTGPLRERIEKLLKDQINPSLASHGGFIRIVDLVDSVLYVSMEGGCQGCGMAATTLREGVEKMLLSEVPEISKIVDSTNHHAGSNPYY